MYRADSTVVLESPPSPSSGFDFEFIGDGWDGAAVVNLPGVQIELEGQVASGQVTIRVIGDGNNRDLNGTHWVRFFRITANIPGVSVTHTEQTLSTSQRGSELRYIPPTSTSPSQIPGLLYLPNVTAYGKFVAEHVEDFPGEVYTQVFEYTHDGTMFRLSVAILYEVR